MKQMYRPFFFFSFCDIQVQEKNVKTMENRCIGKLFTISLKCVLENRFEIFISIFGFGVFHLSLFRWVSSIFCPCVVSLLTVYVNPVWNLHPRLISCLFFGLHWQCWHLQLFFFFFFLCEKPTAVAVSGCCELSWYFNALSQEAFILTYD